MLFKITPQSIEKWKQSKKHKSLYKAIFHKDTKIREDAIDALCSIADARAAAYLTNALKTASYDPTLSQKIKEALVKIGPDALEPLHKLVKAKYRLIKAQSISEAHEAMLVIKEIANERSVSALIELTDSNAMPSVLYDEAISTLVNIGKPAVKQLIDALQKEPVLKKRFACEALGKIGNKEATDSLIEILKDTTQDWHRHYDAAEALALITDEKSLSPLIDAYNQYDNTAREPIIRALGNFNDPRAREIILNGIKDKRKGIQHEAIIALCKIANKQSASELLYLLKVGSDQNRLEKIGEALINLRDPEVNINAVEILTKKALWACECEKNPNMFINLIKKCDTPKAHEAIDKIESKYQAIQAQKEQLNRKQEQYDEELKKAYSSGSVRFFECDVPGGDGLCSDNSCPCPEVRIARGTGYLFIEEELVEFRKRYQSISSARAAMQQSANPLQSSRASIFYRLGPILVCEQGAKLRNLDLNVASADARYWWETGKVPLRATPLGT